MQYWLIDSVLNVVKRVLYPPDGAGAASETSVLENPAKGFRTESRPKMVTALLSPRQKKARRVRG